MALALLCAGVVVGVEGRSSHWRQYSSAHFTLYSDRDPRQSVQLLQQFERFRYAALVVTDRDTGRADEPVSIFLFRRKEDYQAVQPNKEVAGFYREGWSGPEMVVGAEAKLRDVSLILFHEYVHFLVRSRSQVRYPSWYDEGFADLMAASHVAEDHVLIGLVHPWRKGVLEDAASLLPLEKLLTTDAAGGAADSSFYASSWLLLHYLQLGHLSSDRPIDGSLADYLHGLSTGADPVATFESHFGLSVQVAQSRLRAYSDQRQWKGYKLPLPAQDYPVDARSLHANEAAYLLGGLAYRAGQPAAALEFLQRIDASDPSVAPAFSLRAIIEGHMGRSDLAQHILGFALAKDSNSSVVLGNAAHVHWDLARSAGVTGDARANCLQRVKAFARAALRADRSNIEAARFLAEVHRAEGRMADAIELLLQQYRTRSGDVRLNLELGEFYLQAGEPAKALTYLENVMQWDHSNVRRQQAAAMLQSIFESKPALVGELQEDHASPLRIAPRQ